MSSSFKPTGRPMFPNVSAPEGGKPASAYSRFIPREELGDVSAWKPGAFDGGVERRAQPRPENAPEPTAEQWRAQIAAARQSGYQDGYRDGLVALEGFKQSFAAQMSAQVGHLITGFDQQLGALERQMAQAVARAAVLLARQVVRHELDTRPEHVVPLATEAVNAVLMSARHVTVRVHPDDHALVAAGASEALDARGARLLPDATLQRGSCVIDSDVGTIDASIEGRWSLATAAFGSDVGWHDRDGKEEGAAPDAGSSP